MNTFSLTEGMPEVLVEYLEEKWIIVDNLIEFSRMAGNELAQHTKEVNA